MAGPRITICQDKRQDAKGLSGGGGPTDRGPRHRWGRCLCGSHCNASAEGSVLESTQCAVACTIAVPCFRAGICITDEFIIRPAHMTVAVKVPKGPSSSDLQCQTYLHRQTVGNCRVGSGGRSMPGIAIPRIDTYAPHSNVEAPPSAMVLAACGRRQDTGGVSRKACRPSFAGEPKAKPAVSRCG